MPTENDDMALFRAATFDCYEFGPTFTVLWFNGWECKGVRFDFDIGFVQYCGSDKKACLWVTLARFRMVRAGIACTHWDVLCCIVWA